LIAGCLARDPDGAADRFGSFGKSAGYGRLGTLPSAEDVPSLAEMARWSSHRLNQSWQQCGPQDVARLQQCRTIDRRHEKPPPRDGRRVRSWLFPQHIHRIPTGPTLGMRERPHCLAAQPFTRPEKPALRSTDSPSACANERSRRLRRPPSVLMQFMDQTGVRACWVPNQQRLSRE
jgi:hypothetical protein